MDISKLLETARRSMAMHQYAIGLTGENISNVNTPGYSRQRVRIDFNGFSQLGGISEENVQRIRQQFTDRQFWNENQELGRYQSENLMLSRMQDILSEPEAAGLTNAMGEFWDSWNDLVNDQSPGTKSVVANKGAILADTFNRIYNQNKTLQSEVSTEVEQTVSDINSLASRIADLNGRITTGETELLDQRDLLVDELSKLVNIQSNETENSGLTLSIGGLVLVSGSTYNQLSTSRSANDENAGLSVLWGDSNTNAVITSGSLKGLLDIHNQQIPDLIDRLDTLADALKSQINEIHQSGVNDEGQSNFVFFSSDGSGASGLHISQAIQENPDLIAVSDSSGASIAEQINNLQYNEDAVSGMSFFDHYSSTVTALGAKVQETGFKLENQQLITEKLSMQRLSVSGVSLDEEMTHLIEYEQAYNAAARLVNTVNDLNQSILNMI